MSFDDIQQAFFLYSLSLPRLIACFIFLPILNKKTLGGAMIRNAILFSLALFAFPLINQEALPDSIDGTWIILILVKEMLIGMLIGFIAAIPFWAIEATGFLIDNQRGAAMASMFNPLLGSQTTPTAVLFTQTLITLFFSGGGFVSFMYAVFKSYSSWPILEFFPSINSDWVAFFYGLFEQLLYLGILMSAPLVLAMFLAEFGLALISRFAPQLNVFSLSMPIKSAVSSALIIVYLALLMQYFQKSLIDITFFQEQLNSIFINKGP